MKSLHRHLLAAALVAGAAVAVAQTPVAPAAAPAVPAAAAPAGQAPSLTRGHHGRWDPARAAQFRAERMARRLGKLKQALQITAQQEGAWSAWAGALQPVARQRPDRAEFERLSTPERIDRIRALRAQRSAALDQRLEATKTFYAALDAQQQKVFDAAGLRFMRAGWHGGHFGRHHRG